MSILDDKEIHSRSSQDTNLPDLEKGEHENRHEEEDDQIEEVITHITETTFHQLNTDSTPLQGTAA